MATQKTKNRYRIDLGRWGENLATSFLIEKGFSVVERNYRTPEGEIDIVAKNLNTLIFVEVKTRSSSKDGFPEENVNDEKIEHLSAAAEWYLDSHPDNENDWQVDVISILGTPNSAKPKIEWFENVS